VAHNAAVDHMRRRRPQPVQDVVDEYAAQDDAGPRCAESLRTALASLTAPEREILMLRALGGYTPPEIATQVCRSRGSINTLYHRARTAAQENLTAVGAAPSTRSRINEAVVA
jgi:RNA polymerase sigma-70 factor (ECF subfamily)